MPASPSVSFGLVGAGHWGTVLIKTLATLAPLCRLTHLATSRPQSAPAGLTLVGHWSELLSAPCDALIIASPPPSHAEIVAACVRAGKPCIVEKPLTSDLESTLALHEVVSSGQVPVLVDHIHLFSPAYARLRRELGGERPRKIYSEAGNPLRRGASVLWDWGPHDLSLCLDLAGSPVQRFQAMAGPDLEQVAMRLDFEDGPRCWIHHGRMLPGRRRSLSVWTDTRLLIWDDVEKTMTVNGEGLDFPLEPTPVASMLSHFCQGLADGDRFGTGLAVEIARLLDRAERQCAAMGSESSHIPLES